jgi:spermidine/putrescine transport system permease protein
LSKTPSDKTAARVAASGWLALPALLWYAAFLVAPLMIVVVTGFATRGPYGGVVWRLDLASHRRALEPLYAEILWNSVKLAGTAALSCTVLGLPMAYLTARAAPRRRGMLLLLVMLPFFTNFIVRAYAIRALLGAQGPFFYLMRLLGHVDWARELAVGPAAVWYGMVTNYLPFMVLPLYVVLERFDFRLLDAARDLGARRLQIFWRVLLPLIAPGLAAGMLLVFVPALGEFLIPDFLGGARTMLVGNLVTEQFLKARDWPFGAALVSQLLAALLLVIGARSLIFRAVR